MVFTTLHRLLGLGPGPITDELLDAAITARLPESDDLEWKSQLPPTKGLADDDFPKDIAALANSGGGLIVYGVKEDEKKPTGRKDTGELDENHERTLRAAAWGAITPPVFGLGIHRIGDEGNRAVAVEVPASTEGPHLLFKNHFFGAPIRNDADTEWMRERQIEAAYRARLEDRRRATEALAALYDEAATNWSLRDGAWLVAVAQPRLQVTGVERPSRAEAVAIFNKAAQLGKVYDGGGVHPIAVTEWMNPRPGLRRWVAANVAGSGLAWRASWASIHHDGSVSLATRVGGHRINANEFAENFVVTARAIESAVADFMGMTRSAAERFGAGEYDVQVGIESSSPAELVIQTVDQYGQAYQDSSTPLKRFFPVTVSVYTEVPPGDYFWQVHDLAKDCVNQGGITELSGISPPPRES